MTMAFELSVACGVDARERQLVNLMIREGKGHNNFDIKSDVIVPIRRHFPDLTEGGPLELRTLARLVGRQPEKLAVDVQARAPYSADWVPQKPPFRLIRIIDGGRDI